MTKYTTQYFIDRANKIHNNIYDYSKTIYKNGKEKVIIICKLHGEFLQIPNSHLNGNGCLKCGRIKIEKSRTPTLQEFIDRSNKVHNNTYDYSKTIYKKSNTPVIIICKTHGEFLQRPDSHLQGIGCPKCGRIKQRQNITLTLKNFISKAKKIHNNFYDYSKTIYTGCKNKVIIICKKHGDFLQLPNDHLNGCGCILCGRERIGNTFRLTKNDFIKKAKLIHKNKYDYSKSIYKNSKEKIIIICTKHGEFLQIPNSHLMGGGCPLCKESHGERIVANFLNKNKINFIRGARFSECRNKKPLPFDFYIPNKNICIEYDGLQHSIKTSQWFNKIISFNDGIKTLFCQDQGIQLIRISYKDYNNIEQILTEKLKLNIGIIKNVQF